MAEHVDPFETARNLAASGEFGEAAALLRDIADETREHALSAVSISWGGIRAAARRGAKCEVLAAHFENRAVLSRGGSGLSLPEPDLF